MRKSKLVTISALMVIFTFTYIYIRLSQKDQDSQSSEKNLGSMPKVSNKLPPPPPTLQKKIPAPSIAPAAQKKGNRTFYGTLPPHIQDISDLKLVNKSSDQWQKKLNTHLRRLGGERLKTLQITPQESYIISEGDAGRLVERVIVKLESKDGVYTSFFAEVDSESGHVLKTWGVAIPEKARHRH